MRSQVTAILAVLLVGDPDISVAARLCHHAAATLRVTGAGVALMDAEARHAGMLAASDGPSEAMEELQFTLGEGPCVDASHSRRPVLHPDLEATGATRWPGFGPAAMTRGVRAVFAFPVQVGAIRLGALDLYRDTPVSLTDHQLTDALDFADAATTLLLQLQEASDDGSASPLTEAYDNRAVVHQATGMVSVQLDVDLAQALLRLRAHAYAEQRPIASVAGNVVERRLRFDHSTRGTSQVF